MTSMFCGKEEELHHSIATNWSRVDPASSSMQQVPPTTTDNIMDNNNNNNNKGSRASPSDATPSVDTATVFQPSNLKSHSVPPASSPPQNFISVEDDDTSNAVCFRWIRHPPNKLWRDTIKIFSSNRVDFPDWSSDICEHVLALLQLEGITRFLVCLDQHGVPLTRLFDKNKTCLGRWCPASYEEIFERTRQRFLDDRKPPVVSTSVKRSRGRPPKSKSRRASKMMLVNPPPTLSSSSFDILTSLQHDLAKCSRLVADLGSIQAHSESPMHVLNHLREKLSSLPGPHDAPCEVSQLIQMALDLESVQTFVCQRMQAALDNMERRGQGGAAPPDSSHGSLQGETSEGTRLSDKELVVVVNVANNNATCSELERPFQPDTCHDVYLEHDSTVGQALSDDVGDETQDAWNHHHDLGSHDSEAKEIESFKGAEFMHSECIVTDDVGMDLFEWLETLGMDVDNLDDDHKSDAEPFHSAWMGQGQTSSTTQDMGVGFDHLGSVERFDHEFCVFGSVEEASMTTDEPCSTFFPSADVCNDSADNKSDGIGQLDFFLHDLSQGLDDPGSDGAIVAGPRRRGWFRGVPVGALVGFMGSLALLQGGPRFDVVDVSGQSILVPRPVGHANMVDMRAKLDDQDLPLSCRGRHAEAERSPRICAPNGFGNSNVNYVAPVPW